MTLRNRKRASPDASHVDGPPTTKKKTAVKPPSSPEEKTQTKLPAKGLTESGDGPSFPYRVTWEDVQFNVQKTPKGLENKSFTDCYRNSAYQSLMSIPAFVTWLQKYHGDNHKTKLKDNTDRHCPGCEMLRVYNVVYELAGVNRSEAKQKALLREVDHFFSDRDGYFKNKGLNIGQSPHLKTWERLWGRRNMDCDGNRAGQQEAMEFIQFVVEALINRDSRESRGKVEAKFDAEAKEAAENLFGLQLDSTYTCVGKAKHCNHLDQDPQHYRIDLMLKDQESNAAPFRSLLDSFEYAWSKRNESFNCPVKDCKGIGMVNVRTRIDFAPEVLFVWPERSAFKKDKRGGVIFTKSHDDIEFGEVLDLSKYLSQNATKKNQTAIYNLSAIILHGGEELDGHYVTLVKAPSGVWHLLNNYKVKTGSSLQELLEHKIIEGFSASVFTYVKAEAGGEAGGEDGNDEDNEDENGEGNEDGNGGGHEEEGDELDNENCGAFDPTSLDAARVTVDICGWRYRATLKLAGRDPTQVDNAKSSAMRKRITGEAKVGWDEAEQSPGTKRKIAGRAGKGKAVKKIKLKATSE